MQKNVERLSELLFNPKKRKLEYWLVRQAERAIRESKKIPKKEKDKEINSWWNYLLEYEREYNKYLEQKLFEEIEKNLKETDLLVRDYEAEKMWEKYCFKRDSLMNN